MVSGESTIVGETLGGEIAAVASFAAGEDGASGTTIPRPHQPPGIAGFGSTPLKIARKLSIPGEFRLSECLARDIGRFRDNPATGRFARACDGAEGPVRERRRSSDQSPMAENLPRGRDRAGRGGHDRGRRGRGSLTSTGFPIGGGEWMPEGAPGESLRPANYLLFPRGLSLLLRRVLPPGLSRGHASATAILPVLLLRLHPNHLLFPFPERSDRKALRHPQMHLLAKSRGSRYSCRFLSIIRTIRP